MDPEEMKGMHPETEGHPDREHTSDMENGAAAGAGNGAKDGAAAEAENGAQDGGAAGAAGSAKNGAAADGAADRQETPGEPDGTGDGPAGSEPDGSDGKDGAGKGFFGRKKDRRDKKDIRIEELEDRVRRQMAEFDNFRKRTEKEKSAMYEVGAKSVIEQILPVVDNFERGLQGTEDSTDPFVQGMQKIYKQMQTALEAMDVKRIEAVGQEFNPDLHNAVMHCEDDSVGENIIVQELQAGYTYRGNVVRYSMVKVAN